MAAANLPPARPVPASPSRPMNPWLKWPLIALAVFALVLVAIGAYANLLLFFWTN
jgi:hypothetical protein